MLIRYVESDDRSEWYRLDKHLPENGFEDKVTGLTGMKNLLILSIVAGFLFANAIGCTARPIDRELTVQVREWSELGGEDADPVVFSPVFKGDELYSGFSSTITVKNANEDRVVLAIDGCLVEPNKDGTINMNKEPLKSVTLEEGGSIELVSQTMDAGVNITITFE